jgi:hypothetical protein
MWGVSERLLSVRTCVQCRVTEIAASAVAANTAG